MVASTRWRPEPAGQSVMTSMLHSTTGRILPEGSSLKAGLARCCSAIPDCADTFGFSTGRWSVMVYLLAAATCCFGAIMGSFRREKSVFLPIDSRVCPGYKISGKKYRNCKTLLLLPA